MPDARCRNLNARVSEAIVTEICTLNFAGLPDPLFSHGCTDYSVAEGGGGIIESQFSTLSVFNLELIDRMITHLYSKVAFQGSLAFQTIFCCTRCTDLRPSFVQSIKAEGHIVLIWIQSHDTRLSRDQSSGAVSQRIRNSQIAKLI